MIWFEPRIGLAHHLGTVEIRRTRYLDISDPAAITDEVSDYEVSLDGTIHGKVRHRYGDGAWVLIRKAMEVLAPGGAGS